MTRADVPQVVAFISASFIADALSNADVRHAYLEPPGSRVLFMSYSRFFADIVVSHTVFHIQLCHTQLFTHNFFIFFQLYFSILHHFLCFSFPRPPRPATTFVPHYWKKLSCGVIRSLNFTPNPPLQTPRAFSSGVGRRWSRDPR